MIRNWLKRALRRRPPALKPAEVTTIAAEAASSALPQPSPRLAPVDMVPIVYGKGLDSPMPVAVFTLDPYCLAYYHHPARSSHCFANETDKTQ